MNQEITFLSDGDDKLRELQVEMSPQATHILDWFHLSMKLTGLGQYGSPVKVTLPLSVCYTPGLRQKLAGGGHHAGQSVRTFCGEKSHFRDGTWHAGTRLGGGATRCLVCPDRPEAVHPHGVVFDRL